MNSKTKNMAVIAVMAALICVAGPLSISVGPIPLSLASFAVYLAGAVLGAKRGTLAVAIYLLIGLLFPSIVSSAETYMCLGALTMTIVSFYLVFFLLAVLTTITERKNIHAKPVHLLVNLFTFPVFMLSYVPIALVAAVKKVDWVPTRHTISKSLEEIDAE